ncbi:MAG TPA: hypothetical protein VNF04_05720, partial [Stellaceae bacterium]|nr:hypothetical protein [Stellaceae bacterium]
MGIERPEKLPFALYHGTSNIWRQSIEERGLGGRRIVEEFRAVECLRATISYFEKLPSAER